MGEPGGKVLLRYLPSSVIMEALGQRSSNPPTGKMESGKALVFDIHLLRNKWTSPTYKILMTLVRVK